MLSSASAMAGENEDYDLLEDVGEEVDYDDYTLEDEDLGTCFRPMTGRHLHASAPSHQSRSFRVLLLVGDLPEDAIDAAAQEDGTAGMRRASPCLLCKPALPLHPHCIMSSTYFQSYAICRGRTKARSCTC